MFRQRYEDFREKGQNQNAAARVDLPKSFIDFPKPMIAAINGLALGFGITMPLNCDIRLASSTEKFSFAFAQVGVTPEFGSSYFLPRLIRYAKAAELAGIHLMRDVSRGEFCHMPRQLVKPGAPGAGNRTQRLRGQTSPLFSEDFQPPRQALCPRKHYNKPLFWAMAII